MPRDQNPNADLFRQMHLEKTWLNGWARDLLVEKALREGEQVFEQFRAKELQILAQMDFGFSASGVSREQKETMESEEFEFVTKSIQALLDAFLNETRELYSRMKPNH